MPSAVKIDNLKFTWPGAEQPTLDIPSLAVETGEKVFLLGASGSGKSTLLNLIGGILLPQQGSIEVLGTNLASMGGRARDRFRARHVGFVFQQFNLIPYLDVETNIAIASHFGGNQAKGLHEKCQLLLDSLGMSRNLLSRRADSLSVGQQQRVAVARAMINDPEIIIADEPTSALDNAVRDDFMQLLTQAAASYGATILFVSHDQTLSSHFDRVLSLESINHAMRGELADVV